MAITAPNPSTRADGRPLGSVSLNRSLPWRSREQISCDPGFGLVFWGPLCGSSSWPGISFPSEVDFGGHEPAAPIRVEDPRPKYLSTFPNAAIPQPRWLNSRVSWVERQGRAGISVSEGYGAGLRCCGSPHQTRSVSRSSQQSVAFIEQRSDSVPVRWLAHADTYQSAPVD